MKPIIIYSLARSRSTVVLQAARRPNKMYEPFDAHHLVGDPSWANFASTHHLNVPAQTWSSIHERMDDPNTATKFFGTGLQTFIPARKWFDQVVENNSHEVFVLARDPFEIGMSFLLAPHFGWRKDLEPEKLHEVHIREFQFWVLVNALDAFVRFFPKNARLIRFDSLPEEFLTGHK